MSKNSFREVQTISLSAEEKHGQLGVEFERNWHEGNRPRIEEWILKVPEVERPALFCDLARREKNLRNDTAVLDEFRQRFPGFGVWIETAFVGDANYDIDLDKLSPLPAIPGYRIVEQIAVGGMGVVYKAVQIELDRTVALKMVRGGRWVKADELARFKIEARAVAGIDHPHIVSVHDFGEFEGLPYFTMEYIDGGSLLKKLAAEPMDFRESAVLIETLARAMEVVHNRQIVHRDLKPGNILLTKNGTPKISDFGLAKRLGVEQSMTVVGTVMGTASYMAPEQARGDKNLNCTVDIYALGAILFECLTGQPPFRDDTYERTIRRVTDEEPRRPREIITSIPLELEAICMHCLEKDPTRRYRRAAGLADDLKRYLDGEPISIGTYDLVEQHGRWAKRVGLDELDMIGCTETAFVYRARESIINRKVVLKLCNGNIGSPAHARLLRQAEAMAGLGHPNIEQLFMYAEPGDHPYLMHEFVDGRSFSAIMRERVIDPDAEGTNSDSNPSAEASINRLPARKIFTPVTADLAAEWIEMLARAVHFVHEHHVLHGAIYPGELRLMRDGVPKLCGFGAAQKLQNGKPPREASASWVRPNYQSPEQIAANWSSLSVATDVYCLGAVLYELLTGQAPFFGLGIQETRDAVLKEIPIAPRNLNPRIPSLLDYLVQRCLAKKPEDRFASAEELADALQRYLRSTAVSDDETANFDSLRDDAPTTGDFELRIYPKGHHSPTIFPLPRRWVAIGRALESDVVIQDEFCSRNHCAIYWDDHTNQHILILIKAKHGVKVNGELVRGSQALVAGDMIDVASGRMAFDRKGGRR